MIRPDNRLKTIRKKYVEKYFHKELKKVSLDKGYLLSFNQKKEIGVKEILVDGKTIV